MLNKLQLSSDLATKRLRETTYHLHYTQTGGITTILVAGCDDNVNIFFLFLLMNGEVGCMRLYMTDCQCTGMSLCGECEWY